MSWTEYNESIADIREVYGMDLYDARELYTEMREELGRPVTVEDLVDVLEMGEEPEVREEYYEGLTPEGETDWQYWEGQYEYFDDSEFDDGWLDTDDEVEFTVEYREAE